jgi:hypothetical protein
VTHAHGLDHKKAHVARSRCDLPPAIPGTADSCGASILIRSSGVIVPESAGRKSVVLSDFNETERRDRIFPIFADKLYRSLVIVLLAKG